MILLTVLFLVATPPADSWTCKEVRWAIKAAGSPERAEEIARSMGVSNGLIDKAKKCLRVRRIPAPSQKTD